MIYLYFYLVYIYIYMCIYDCIEWGAKTIWPGEKSKKCTQVWCKAHVVQNTLCLEHFLEVKMEKCTSLRGKALVKVQTYKTHHARTTFGS